MGFIFFTFFLLTDLVTLSWTLCTGHTALLVEVISSSGRSSLSPLHGQQVQQVVSGKFEYKTKSSFTLMRTSSKMSVTVAYHPLTGSWLVSITMKIFMGKFSVHVTTVYFPMKIFLVMPTVDWLLTSPWQQLLMLSGLFGKGIVLCFLVWKKPHSIHLMLVLI